MDIIHIWPEGKYRFKVLISTSSIPGNDNEVKVTDFTTAGDWDCVAAVERLPALHYSVDFIFLSFGIMGFIVEF